MTKAEGRRISKIILKKCESKAKEARYALDVLLTDARKARAVHRKFLKA
jgi:ssRNA-specific RNase YbeY (16S rRNA maturation enzyme)